MKITKQRLKEIIKEELVREGKRTRMSMPAISMADMEAAMTTDSPGLGDLQSDERFTGGTPIEKLNMLIKARKDLAAMSKEELTALSKSLDAEQAAELRHLLANPMYAPMDEAATEADIVRLMNAEKITRPQARVKLGLPANKRNPNQTRGASTKPNQGRFGGY